MAPSTMISLKQGKPLLLYLTSTPKSIEALLVQEEDGLERPVYYSSRVIRNAEVRYTPTERHYLALTSAAQKFRHYFLSHVVHLMTRCDPLRYLLSKPTLSGRMARWLLLLAEFDIVCLTPKAIKSQALADLLAQFPNGEFEPPFEALDRKSTRLNSSH